MAKSLRTKGVVGIVVLFTTFIYFSGSNRKPSESPEILNELPEILKESPKMLEESPIFVLYNRVPKCGSSFFKHIVWRIRDKNGFKPIDSIQDENIFPSGKDLVYQTNRELIETRNLIMRLDQKTLYVEHTNFINLRSPKVAYINLIRDPIKRVNSVYCYVRDLTKKSGQLTYARIQTEKSNETLALAWLSTPLEQCILEKSIPHCINTFNLFVTIKYFCGFHPRCHHPNTDTALDRAIANIDQYYSVVGVLEQINKTLAVMKDKLPGYFTGAGQGYEELLRQVNHNINNCRADLPALKEKDDPMYQLLKEHLKREYRLYEYVRDKLELQYSSIGNV